MHAARKTFIAEKKALKATCFKIYLSIKIKHL